MVAPEPDVSPEHKKDEATQAGHRHHAAQLDHSRYNQRVLVGLEGS